jgi:saccharopine dehydrogenase-like NADP-dependent oxidoreductase
MHRVAVLGAGRVGMLVACLLAESGDYKIYLIDKSDPSKQDIIKSHSHIVTAQMDLNCMADLTDYLQYHGIDNIISCLPFNFNVHVASIAYRYNMNYFDLTEDVETAADIKTFADKGNSLFAPQCGLAVGALPLNISNPLQYGLSWSTSGLVNEYSKMCEALQNGQKVHLKPLYDLEEIKLDGISYEAFNTSGGLGSLIETYGDKAKDITYKSIRHPGHQEKMHFLLYGLKMFERQQLLCEIMDSALPKIDKDRVVIYVSAIGWQEGVYKELHYSDNFYSGVKFGKRWTALQLTTAQSACVTVDLALKNCFNAGFLRQESISLDSFINNRFARYFKEWGQHNAIYAI